MFKCLLIKGGTDVTPQNHFTHRGYASSASENSCSTLLISSVSLEKLDNEAQVSKIEFPRPWGSRTRCSLTGFPRKKGGGTLQTNTDNREAAGRES